MEKYKAYIWGGFLFILIAGLGCLMIYEASRNTILIYQSSNWPSTSGQIVSSNVEVYTSSKRTSYYPKIIYRYTVEGKSFEGSRITYQLGRSDREEAEEQVAKYPTGSVKSVFYNPNLPEESCLEAGGAVTGYYIFFILGTLFILFAIWVFCRSTKPYRRCYAVRSGRYWS